MIVRVWRAKASKTDPEAYARHFRSTVLPQLKTISGFSSATLLQEIGKDGLEYVAMTRWVSVEAIKSFAGADYSVAVVDDEAAAVLSSYDHAVRHYEAVLEERTQR